MSHLGSFEHVDNYICNTKLTCQKCYTESNCSRNDENKLQYSNCNILFFDPDCFRTHMFNKVFKPIQFNYTRLTPCQYLFFCNGCDKICPHFTFFSKINVKKT